MFRKYKQQCKSQRFSNLPRSNTVNLPTISFGSAKREEKTKERNEKNVGRYKSQRKFSFAQDNQKGRRNIPTPLIQFKQKQVPPILNSHRFPETEQKIQEKQFFTARQKQVYVSPPKRRKFEKLPEILAEGDFIKRKQDSMDSSYEDEKLRKKMFQFDFIKSQDKKLDQQNSYFNKTKMIDEVIAKKLRIKDKDKGQSLNLLKQVQNSIIKNQINQQRLKEAIQRLSNEHQASQLVGPQAVQKFYIHYKKIDQIKQLQEMKKQSNPLTVILTILENYNIPPKRMDIIKMKGVQSILDLNHIGLGHSISIKAISEILDSLKYFDSINLSYNFISFDRIDVIVPKLKGLKRIDLSHNRIGKVGVDMMANIVLCKKKSETSQSQIDEDKLLQSLNLQENGLPDTAVNLFLIKAKAFQNLKILNLSKNFLGNNFALHLKEFLIDQECLQELYLHWNDITSKGMKLIFQGLSLNRNLKVLDLSWNQIGYEAIPSICNFFKKNNTLLHLDISNCNVCLVDASILAESIKYNNTIFGIHFQGNQGFVDSFGYIHAKKKQDDDLVSLMDQILTRIKGVKRRNFNNGKISEESEVKTCWICEDWQQQTIKVMLIKQSDAGCFIHFDFDNFKGLTMEVVDGNYEIKRMLPYRRVRFFITKVNKKKQFIHQATGNFKLSETQFDIQMFQDPFVVRQFYIESKQFVGVSFKQLNFIDVSSNKRKEMFKYDYQYQPECRPRSRNVFVDQSLFVEEQPPTKDVKKKIKIKIKIKKQRNRENDKKARQLFEVQNYFTKAEINTNHNSKNQVTLSNISKSFTSKCALFDLENSKIKKLITSEEQVQKVYQVFQQNYSVFSNIYRYLSNNAVNSMTSVYYISETRLDNFLDFMQFQTKTMTRVKIRLKLFAALSVNDDFSKMELKNGDVEQKLLNRPQFFQFLLRIAMEKYPTNCKFKKQQDSMESNSISQGLRQLLKSLKSYEITIQMPRQWRSEHLTSYDISLVIKSYEHFIESIYSHYAGIFQKNMSVRLQKKMLLNELKQIFIDSGIKKSRQSLKDAELAFIQSKQTQVQEGTKESGLSYNEFLEALIRIAYANNLKPIGTQQQRLWERIELMSKQSQKTEYRLMDFTIPLFFKFQALLKSIHTGNRYLHRLKKMDRIFQKGLFPEEAQMMMEIFKQRLEEMYKIERQHNAIQSKTSIPTPTKPENFHSKLPQTHSLKLTLHHLVQRLKIKYNKLSQELDRNYNEYDQISQPQNDDDKQQKDC